MKVFIPCSRNIDGILSDLERFGIVKIADVEVVVVAMKRDNVQPIARSCKSFMVVRVAHDGMPETADDGLAVPMGEKEDIFVCNGGTTVIAAAITYMCDAGLRGRRLDVQFDGVTELIVPPIIRYVRGARQDAVEYPEEAHEAADAFPYLTYILELEV